MKTITAILLLTALSAIADTVSYKYDDAGRLISAAYDNGTTVAYSYDKAGNLLGRAIAGGAPTVSSGGVVNAATFTAPLVRGELGTIFGSGFAATPASATKTPWPVSLGGIQVTVAGTPAPLYFVNGTQINFQVPFEAPISGSVPVVVSLNGAAAPAQQVAMAEYAPGIFGYARTATILDPIIVHGADNSLVTPDNPASAGEVLVIYATGAGSFDNPPATGAAASAAPIANTKVLATVTAGGAPAQVLFSGLTPGFIGLMQINVQLPSPLASGTQPLVVAFGSSAASPVNLYVK
jgi:uncharacterized protein (TIGR03437 family)